MAQQTITLGRSTGVQATFGPEGLSARFGKLFKKEIQTGDALFDEHVHVKTATEDATTKLLDSSEVRTVIERVVSEGGAVAIDDKTVTIELPDGVPLDQALVQALVEAVGH
jgi:hypothetical protein